MKPTNLILCAEQAIAIVCTLLALVAIAATLAGYWWNIIFAVYGIALAASLVKDIRRILLSVRS